MRNIGLLTLMYMAAGGFFPSYPLLGYRRSYTPAVSDGLQAKFDAAKKKADAEAWEKAEARRQRRAAKKLSVNH